MEAIKWIVIAGVVSTILAGVGWTIDRLMMVSTLKANNAVLVETNSENVTELHFFRNDAAKKEQQLEDKQRDYEIIHNKYEGLRGEVDDVKELLSESEAACAASAVPDLYVDVMHKTNSSSKDRSN